MGFYDEMFAGEEEIMCGRSNRGWRRRIPRHEDPQVDDYGESDDQHPDDADD